MKKYFLWHYTEGIKNFLGIFRNFLKYSWRFFSVGLLLQTLFYPWRRDIAFASWRGFHPLLELNRLINNFISRLMGAVVRLPVILVGLLVEVAILIFGIAGFVLWLGLPIFFIAALIIFVGFFRKNSGHETLYKIGVGDVLFFSVWMWIVSIYGFIEASRKGWSQKSLPALAHGKWFLRVWNRMGFIKPDADFQKNFSDPVRLEKELRGIGLSTQDFQNILNWEIHRQKKVDDAFKFWKEEKLMAVPPLGKSWTYAYTLELDKYSIALPVKEYFYKDAYALGHKKDIEMIETALSRPVQNSIVLVGEAGVGKKTLINLLANQIKEGKVMAALRDKRLLEVDLHKIATEAGSNFFWQIDKIFRESVYAGNIILVINNIHEFLSDKVALDVSSLLGKYLAMPTFQMIGLTTPEEFHSNLETDGSLMEYLDKLLIDGLSPEETIFSLLHILEKEEKNRVIATYQSIKEVVELSDQYITDSPLPEKAIDLLEEALIRWFRQSPNYFLMKKDVDQLFEEKLKIPVGEVGQEEKEKLTHLEEILHQRVIGQDEAVKQVAEAMRRTRAGIADTKKPIGSFLFLGPTGVGKTETAKALAEAYFGSEDRMIRLDMSEFQTPDAVGRILGSDQLNIHSQFVAAVTENPFSVLLLDEIEKAYPDILNLFLQVLDEGWLTDAFGKKIIFKNMIIIATSNAGAEIIKEGIEKKMSDEELHVQVIDHVIRKGIFKPEFLNRFEEVLFFSSLNGEALARVTGLIVEKAVERIYERKNIEIDLNRGIVEKIIEKGYDPIFGARSIKRYVQDKIEDAVAKKIIAEEVVSGQSIELRPEDLE